MKLFTLAAGIISGSFLSGYGACSLLMAAHSGSEAMAATMTAWSEPSDFARTDPVPRMEPVTRTKAPIPRTKPSLDVVRDCQFHARRVEDEYGIPRGLLRAIVQTESSGNPYAINISGRNMSAQTHDLALHVIKGQPADRLDMSLGCAQINTRWHLAAFDSVADLFVPAKNIDYAGRFLLELHDRHGDWRRAAGHFNGGSGENRRWYRCRVVGNFPEDAGVDETFYQFMIKGCL